MNLRINEVASFLQEGCFCIMTKQLKMKGIHLRYRLVHLILSIWNFLLYIKKEKGITYNHSYTNDIKTKEKLGEEVIVGRTKAEKGKHMENKYGQSTQ